MKIIDRLHIKWMARMLRANGGKKPAAARALGISIRTWRNWEIKLGMRQKLPSTRKLAK